MLSSLSHLLELNENVSAWGQRLSNTHFQLLGQPLGGLGGNNFLLHVIFRIIIIIKQFPTTVVVVKDYTFTFERNEVGSVKKMFWVSVFSWPLL